MSALAVGHRDVPGVLKRRGYTELKKIGEGSFGKAILVQSEPDGAKLVCKMVDVSSASTKETQDAVKEGKLLAQFKHPYVVRYRESFIDSGWLCILMDYCEGGDLAGQIEQAKKKRQPIHEDQILRWMTQALLALKYIHDKHVLHRDVKSSNFFLSKAGNLKMGDFGIAKVLSCTAACARTQIGTPYYLSPEVCQEKPYTWPSDVWAMGCIFFELCERRVPFDAANISGLVQKICRGPTPQIGSGYSDFVRNLCSEMLNRNPNLRPSAETILQRARIQDVVRLMLDEAQAAQEEKQPASTNASEDVRSASGCDGQALFPPLPPSCGPYAVVAGMYRRNDLVEYHSNTHKDWLPATVVSVDAEGRIVIDLKPNTWIPRETQAAQVRPRARRNSCDSAAGGAPQVAMGGACGTPMRHRSPSVGSAGAAPGGRGLSPSRGGMAAVPGAALFMAPLDRQSGSRAGTPSRGRWSRDVSPAGVGPVVGALISAGGGGAGSRAGTPSRGASPGPPGFQVRPPGMPRVPGSPLQRPCRAAGVAGMAIAGV
jgi:NIMA (never in mitosis gene a)-related kinase